MGAIVNGMALSRLRAYAGTFLVFSDYMRPPIRLAAIMELPVDLRLHARLRSASARTARPTSRSSSSRRCAPSPGSITIRPGDANEAAEAWRAILAQTERPAVLVLSRQALPTLDRTQLCARPTGVAKGGYVLADSDGGRPRSS